MRMLFAALLGMAAALAHGHAAALTQINAHGFSTASNLALIGVTPFDPALGTLDSVHVTIEGTLGASGIAPAWYAQGPAGPVPIPYSFQVQVTQDFFGLANRFFEFDSAALFTLPGEAQGVGENFLLATQFSYDFSFTAATDLAGFTPVVPGTTFGTLVPPVSASALRSDFLEGLPYFYEVDLVQSASVLSFGAVTPVLTQVQTAGALMVRYEYTPPAPPAEVPAPGSLPLLLAGFAVLGCRRFFQPRAVSRASV